MSENNWQNHIDSLRFIRCKHATATLRLKHRSTCVVGSFYHLKETCVWHFDAFCLPIYNEGLKTRRYRL